MADLVHNKASSGEPRTAKRLRIDSENDDGDEDDVVVMEVVPNGAKSDVDNPAAPHEKDAVEEADVEFVGTANAQPLPHIRCHCPVHRFCQELIVIDGDEEGGPSENIKACDLCYCYACDTPVADCTYWEKHCMASDASEYWKSERQRIHFESQPCLLVASVLDGRRLKWVVQALKCLGDNVNFHCDCDKIDVRIMGCDQKYLVVLKLTRLFFSSYECREKFSFNVNARSLYGGLVKVRKKDGVLLMKVLSNSTLRIEFDQENGHRTDDSPEPYEVKLDEVLDDIANNLTIPDTEFPCVVQMQAKELNKIVDLFHSFSTENHIDISCSPEGMKFALEKNRDPVVKRFNYILKPHAANFDMKCNEYAKLRLDRWALSGCQRVSTSLAPKVKIYMKSDVPLRMQYNFRGGHLTIHVAPHNEADDED